MRHTSFCLRALTVASIFCGFLVAPLRAAPFKSTEPTPLGGPIVPMPNNFAATNSAVGGNGANDTHSPAADEKTTGPLQPSAALGPAPYNLGDIKALQVGSQKISEAPMRVGNLDVLAPLVEELPALGASVSRADLKNVPGGFAGPSEDKNFQINVFNGPPIVFTIGKASAWIDKNEQPLRSAPLIIKDQIWLPVFSIAPLLGAAARLSPDNTLILTPTIQSVELFPVKDTVAITVKTSAPVPPGLAQIKSLSNPNRVYIDFPGYSMGFDARNSTIERLVSVGRGHVSKVRAGMPSKFPDTTRITMDLKKAQSGLQQGMPDPSLYAVVLVDPGESAPVMAEFLDPTPENPVVGPVLKMSGPDSLTDRYGRALKIVVDAGHGGHDTGARGKRSREKDHALDIAKRLANHLRVRGATVLMTRDTDEFISLDGRTTFANQNKADLFVSVHINSSVKSTATGTQTFYQTARSQSLAREVQKELAKATGRPNRGITQARFYVIRNTWMPSILTESAFISNPSEEALLINSAYREKIARGLAQGITNYAAIYIRGGSAS